MHPFRFAVQTSGAASGKEWRELARKTEDLGYSALLIPDHFGDQWGPLVALTIAAEATTTLKVGSLVFDNDYRHPVVLAREIATLDLASEGRVEFGIGAGWLTTDYEQSGISLDRAGVRIDRMVESLRVMKQLWSEGKATYAGEHYTITGAEGSPRPHTKPYPTIVIGGGGKRVLTVAAEEADIVGVNPSLASGVIGPDVAKSATADQYRQRIEWIKAAAGSRFNAIELQMNTYVVQFTDDRRRVAEMLGSVFDLSIDDALDVPIALVGTVDEIVEQLQRQREDYGFSYIVVHTPEMNEFAEVISRLAGT